MKILLALILSLFIGDENTHKQIYLANTIISARTDKGWTLDRLSNKSVVSVASTGVGFYAYAYGAKHGLLKPEIASQWIREGFDNMLAVNRENDGWLHHFVDLSGKPYYNEVSSIDSVIFYAGAEKAAMLLNDNLLLGHIIDCKRKIKISSMIDTDGYFFHGWKFKHGSREMLDSKWRHYNEGILIYKYFNLPFTPIRIDYSLPLFVYYYPLAFYDSEAIWIDHLGKAISYQLRMTGRFGYSAMDAPQGYSVNSPYVISPVSILSCYRYYKNIVNKELDKLGVVWSVQSISVNGEWQSKDRVLLDDGILLMLLEEK